MSVNKTAEIGVALSPSDNKVMEEYLKRQENPHLAIDPSISASDTISCYSNKVISGSVSKLTEEIKVQTALVNKGEMRFAEDILVAQANTLDVIFNHLAQESTRIPINNLVQVKFMETMLRLALKAQNQCRTTLEGLAAIKNPSHVTFTKQQNVAYQQQVNNGTPLQTGISPCSRTEENKISSNELLEEEKYGEWLDIGTQNAASGADKAMEALGAVKRSKNKPRQGKFEPERV